MSIDSAEKDSPKSFEELISRMPEETSIFLLLPCGLHGSSYPAGLHRYLPAMPVFTAGCEDCDEWWVLGLAKGSNILVPHRVLRDSEAAYTLWSVFGERPQKIGNFLFKVAASSEHWQAFVRKTLR